MLRVILPLTDEQPFDIAPVNQLVGSVIGSILTIDQNVCIVRMLKRESNVLLNNEDTDSRVTDCSDPLPDTLLIKR